ncbi:MAG: methyltransferase domain-containing protein, partial [Pseudomonadota bacterium]
MRLLQFPGNSRKDPTGERLVPGSGLDNEALHYHRYLSALEFAKDKRVLDIASGEGYGSWILSQAASQVDGVEIDAETVKRSQIRYKHPKISFQQGDCREIPFEDDTFDLVTCFETLEHIAEHDVLLGELRRVLKPDGILLISTPEVDRYTHSAPANPFHVKELSTRDFRDLLTGHFANVELYGQRLTVSGLMWPVDGPLKDLAWRNNATDPMTSTPHPTGALILVAVASDTPVTLPAELYQIIDYDYPISALQGGAVKQANDFQELTRSLNEAKRLAADRADELDQTKKLLAHARDRLKTSSDMMIDASNKASISQVKTNQLEHFLSNPPVTLEESVRLTHEIARLRKRPLKQFRRNTKWRLTRLALKLSKALGAPIAGKLSKKVHKYSPKTPSELETKIQQAQPLSHQLNNARVPARHLSDTERSILENGPLTPPAKAPKASIIIPVFNQRMFTEACLFSLASIPTDHSFEVIIVDD